MKLPRYPVYVISKGRHDCCLTANFMLRDRVPFRLVVEPQEAELYRARYGDAVAVLPFSNLGLGSIPARNWVWEHSKESGAVRHWIFDDNIGRMRRWNKGIRLPVETGVALAAMEDWVDRYENIGIAGPNYVMFGTGRAAPFWTNVHVYSTLLIRNDMKYRWRGRYNEDTDLCLQVLSGGLCTVLFNAFLIEKRATMKMKGGNMETLYKADGRLKMARSLERMWPGIVTTRRRFQRPQHVIKNQWRGFDTPLIRRSDVDWSSLAQTNEYGMTLTADPNGALRPKPQPKPKRPRGRPRKAAAQASPAPEPPPEGGPSPNAQG